LRLGPRDIHQTQISVSLETVLEPMANLSGVVW